VGLFSGPLNKKGSGITEALRGFSKGGGNNRGREIRFSGPLPYLTMAAHRAREGA